MSLTHKYFFIANYDDISSSMVAFLLNSHPDIHCSESKSNIMLNACDNMNQSVDGWVEEYSNTDKMINGNINQFSAFELQNKILLEKSKYPLRMVSMIASPYLRVRLLMQNWLHAGQSVQAATEEVEKQFDHVNLHNHEIIHRYKLNEIYQEILATATQQQVDCTIPENKLFLFALAKVIAEDCADLPTACKKFEIEKLLTDGNYFTDFLEYLSPSLLITSIFKVSLLQNMQKCADYLIKINNQPLHPWMLDLINTCLQRRFHTIYHTHVDKPLALLYKEAGLTLTNQSSKPHYTKLISIQLNSNRPTQLSYYFDNIEETADHPHQIEVLVNVDDTDIAMQEMLEREMKIRRFTLKYITTPRPQSFCDLWKPINSLLSITDPGAYFLLNISDEMLFATKGWDTQLEKYVGFFPDHIFRLRASRNKFRNYFDRWECSFGQDAIPITTKKWIDVGGDWNPCFGPDSYQQLISYYLAKEGQFSGANYLRELPIIDIKFYGDIPALGISPEKGWRLNRDHIVAMQICQSHTMQQEAKRRAMLIMANIYVAKNQLIAINIEDNKSEKQIQLLDSESGRLITKFDYRLSWLKISLQNQIRKLKFYAYFGGGKEYAQSRGYIKAIGGYLKSKHEFWNRLHQNIKNKRNMKKAA